MYAKKILQWNALNYPDLAVDGAGNIYLTGGFANTIDFDPGPSIYNLTSNGANDISIRFLDNNGDFLWAINMGSGGDDIGIKIVADDFGGIISTGIILVL